MPVKVPRIGQLRRKLTIVYVCEHTCPILGFGTDELEVLRLLFGQLGRALARRGRNRRLGVVKRKLRGFFGHLFHDPYAVLRMTHLHSQPKRSGGAEWPRGGGASATPETGQSRQ